MKVTLIPGHGAGSGPVHHQFLSSTLINDTIAVDAGCIGFYGSPQDQARVRHVILSHTHLDHMASLAIFVENAYEGKADCVTIHGSSVVLDCLQKDVFNDRIWPDFIALSRNNERPFLRLAPFEPGQTIVLEGVQFTSILLNHVVQTAGYLIRDGSSEIAFVSDTAETDEIWKQINARPNVQAVFLEATFPNRMRWLADVSKHLTPELFASEVGKLSRPTRVIAIHLKGRFQDEVTKELMALNLPTLEIGQFGVPYTF